MSTFQAEKILAVLNEHGVRYVLIGGLAASLHGSVTPTFDVDITPEMTRDNLVRLSAALVPEGSRDSRVSPPVSMRPVVARSTCCPVVLPIAWLRCRQGPSRGCSGEPGVVGRR